MDLVQFAGPWNKATARETEPCGHFLAQKQLACALTGDWPCRSVVLQFSTPEKTSSSGQEKIGEERQRMYQIRIMGEGDSFDDGQNSTQPTGVK